MNPISQLLLKKIIETYQATPHTKRDEMLTHLQQVIKEKPSEEILIGLLLLITQTIEIEYKVLTPKKGNFFGSQLYSLCEELLNTLDTTNLSFDKQQEYYKDLKNWLDKKNIHTSFTQESLRKEAAFLYPQEALNSLQKNINNLPQNTFLTRVEKTQIEVIQDKFNQLELPEESNDDYSHCLVAMLKISEYIPTKSRAQAYMNLLISFNKFELGNIKNYKEELINLLLETKNKIASEYSLMNPRKGIFFGSALYSLTEDALNELSIDSKWMDDTTITTAREYYNRAAEAGDYHSIKQLLISDNAVLTTAAQWHELGDDYYIARNNQKKDYAKARACFEQAIKLNTLHSPSLYSLGWMYEQDQGTNKNIDKARKFYQMAANEKNYNAIKQLLILDKPTLTTADEWYALGNNYYATQDASRAKACFEQAITYDKKYAFSLHKLDWIHNTLEQAPDLNREKVRAYYHGASEIGESKAAIQLARFYQLDHKDVKEDLNLAIEYYMKAAKLGNQEALAPLDRLCEEADSKKQLALSSLYGSFFNPKKTDYWRNKATEAEQFNLRM